MTRIHSLVSQLWHDETGFVITAELILISTLLVLGLIVGMSSVQSAVVGELEDVGSAIGSLNQSYQYQGFAARRTIRGAGWWCGGLKSYTAGSAYYDLRDECDGNANYEMGCALSGSYFGTVPTPEGGIKSHDHDKHDHHHHHPPHRDHDRKPAPDKQKPHDASA